MKSRISIEVDFNNGNSPVIQILQASSDDVRDKLIQSFTESFSGSSWCNIRWQDHQDGVNRIIISPITNHMLKEQSKVMAEQIRVYEEWIKKNDYDLDHFKKTGELTYNTHSD